MDNKNKIYNFCKADDVYNRDAYTYLINQQILRTQLQLLKDERLGLQKMITMFTQAEEKNKLLK